MSAAASGEIAPEPSPARVTFATSRIVASMPMIRSRQVPNEHRTVANRNRTERAASALWRGKPAAAGNAVGGGTRPAAVADSAGSVHPARRAGSDPGSLRRAAGSSAVPDPPTEPRPPRYSGRRDHPAIHGLHRRDAGNAAGASAEYLVMAAIL